MAPDVAETTHIARPPRGREQVRCNCLDCSMHIKSLFATAVTSHPARRDWEMTEPTIWSSARCCEATNCKRGSLLSIWSMFLLLKQKRSHASLLKPKRFIVRAHRLETRRELQGTQAGLPLAHPHLGLPDPVLVQTLTGLTTVILIFGYGLSSEGIGSFSSIFRIFFGACFRKRRFISGANSRRRSVIASELSAPPKRFMVSPKVWSSLG
jgi:hypothetical protein